MGGEIISIRLAQGHYRQSAQPVHALDELIIPADAEDGKHEKNK